MPEVSSLPPPPVTGPSNDSGSQPPNDVVESSPQPPQDIASVNNPQLPVNVGPDSVSTPSVDSNNNVNPNINNDSGGDSGIKLSSNIDFASKSAPG